MGDLSAIAVALPTGIAAIITAYALLVRARGATSRPKRVLRSLWIWVEGAGLAGDVPETLARDVHRELDNGEVSNGQDA